MRNILATRRITVADANAQNGAIAYGPMALTQVVGLAGALARKSGVKITGVAPIIHYIKVKCVRNDYGEYDSIVKRKTNKEYFDLERDAASAITDEVTCDMNLTLLFELDLDETQYAERIELAHHLMSHLQQMPICAGSHATSPYGLIVDRLDKKLLVPGYGFRFVRAAQGVDDIIQHHQRASFYAGPEAGWVTDRKKPEVLLATGYRQLVSDCGEQTLFGPGEFLGARNPNYPTALVESTYSFCECVSVTENNVDTLFWAADYRDGNYNCINITRR